MGTEGQIW